MNQNIFILYLFHDNKVINNKHSFCLKKNEFHSILVYIFQTLCCPRLIVLVDYLSLLLTALSVLLN